MHETFTRYGTTTDLMDLNDHDIELIERHSEKLLSSEEEKAFQDRMSSDSEFADEVNLFEQIQGGFKAVGRKELKTNLAGIEAAMLAGGELNDYTPPKKGGSGFGKFFQLLIIGGSFYVGYLAYTGKLEGLIEKYIPSQEIEGSKLKEVPAEQKVAPSRPTKTVVADTLRTLQIRDDKGNVIEESTISLKEYNEILKQQKEQQKPVELKVIEAEPAQ